MSERRLKQIKNSLIEDLDSIDYYGSETANEGLELYNEVIRLREENKDNEQLIETQLRGLEKQKQIIEKAIEYINTRLEEYKNSGLSKKYINHVHYYKLINDLIDILNGRSDE